jgi:hypothetical protein
MHRLRFLGPGARRTRRWRVELGYGLVAFALAWPSQAYAYELDALLRMPLERLLQLHITQQRSELSAVSDRRDGDLGTGTVGSAP